MEGDNSNKKTFNKDSYFETFSNAICLNSDGFFPFPDIIKICSKNNIASIIQPGGSKNDQMVIKAANKSNISMTFTGIRHFKH